MLPTVTARDCSCRTFDDGHAGDCAIFDDGHPIDPNRYAPRDWDWEAGAGQLNDAVWSGGDDD